MSDPKQEHEQEQRDGLDVDDLEPTAELAEEVTGGSGNSRIVTNPPPAVSANP